MISFRHLSFYLPGLTSLNAENIVFYTRCSLVGRLMKLAELRRLHCKQMASVYRDLTASMIDADVQKVTRFVVLSWPYFFTDWGKQFKKPLSIAVKIIQTSADSIEKTVIWDIACVSSGVMRGSVKRADRAIWEDIVFFSEHVHSCRATSSTHATSSTPVVIGACLFVLVKTREAFTDAGALLRPK